MTSHAVDVSGLRIEVTRGDIVAQADVDAIVNAANRQLLPGGGVAGAIHAAAGPDLARECEPLAPIRPGECVITGGHRLPNRYVVHCLGPVHGVDEPASELLAACYRNALRVADDHDVRAVAFPAISTGIFGYPKEEAARVALTAVVDSAGGLRHVRLVRFVLFDRSSLEAHRRALDALSARDRY